MSAFGGVCPRPFEVALPCCCCIYTSKKGGVQSIHDKSSRPPASLPHALLPHLQSHVAWQDCRGLVWLDWQQQQDHTLYCAREGDSEGTLSKPPRPSPPVEIESFCCCDCCSHVTMVSGGGASPLLPLASVSLPAWHLHSPPAAAFVPLPHSSVVWGRGASSSSSSSSWGRRRIEPLRMFDDREGRPRRKSYGAGISGGSSHRPGWQKAERELWEARRGIAR